MAQTDQLLSCRYIAKEVITKLTIYSKKLLPSLPKIMFIKENEN